MEILWPLRRIKRILLWRLGFQESLKRIKFITEGNFCYLGGPKVDKDIHDGSHRATIADRVDYLRTLGVPSSAMKERKNHLKT